MASLGLRPIHLQSLPYGFYRNGSISLVGEALGPPAGVPNVPACRGRTPAGPQAAQVCRPYSFNGTVCENETVALIRHGFAVPPSPLEGEGKGDRKGRPYGENRAGSIGSANSGA